MRKSPGIDHQDIQLNIKSHVGGTEVDRKGSVISEKNINSIIDEDQEYDQSQDIVHEQENLRATDLKNNEANLQKEYLGIEFNDNDKEINKILNSNQTLQRVDQDRLLVQK